MKRTYLNSQNSTLRLLSYSILLTSLATTPTCLAHPLHQHGGVVQGFIHPLTGLDHTLAMLAIGTIAYQKGNKWIWALPLSFIAFTLCGSLIGHASIMLPWFELGITLSVFILGLCLSFPSTVPTVLLLSLVCLFGFCHGYAHGTELPNYTEFAPFAVGFISATALLHLMGILLGKLLMPKLSWCIRLAGISMAFAALIS